MGKDIRSEAVSSITSDDVGRGERHALPEYHIDPKVRSSWHGDNFLEVYVMALEPTIEDILLFTGEDHTGDRPEYY
jgi:hypothetical protein